MQYAIIASIMFIVALLGGILLARNKTVEQSKVVKVIFIGLYFWVVMFAEVIVFAIIYTLLY